MKKRLLTLILLGTIIVTAPTTILAEDTEASSEYCLTIPGVNGFEWGTDML